MHARALTLSLVAVLGSVTTSHAATWMNETNTTLEADFCNLQFPSSFSGVALTPSPVVFGRIYEDGVTSPGGPSAFVSAEVGYGPNNSDPRTDPNWLWFPASFNIQVGNDDEYQSIFTLPANNGTYNYTYRFSLDGGTTLTAADLNGAGSNASLTFETTQLGVFTVTGGLVPEPSAIALLSLPTALLMRRRRAMR
ncbi:MAG TPA: hypothetical protein PK402_10115 [Tepidisphaeraceae bacterium]|nr:hypothetical protein [Tepidisphaeraceae bacterium]